VFLLGFLLLVCITAHQSLGSRKHRKVHHLAKTQKKHHDQAHRTEAHHLSKAAAHVKGNPWCQPYELDDEERAKHLPSGNGFRICQYTGDFSLKICTEETEWTAADLSLSEPILCTLNNVRFHVWSGTYQGIKIAGARDVQGPPLYRKADWSWQAGVATDCVGFFLGIQWKSRAWTSVSDYTAYSTRISSCYITSEIEDQASQAAISIISSILGACGPVGDVLNIIWTVATTLPGVFDPKNNDIVHSLAVCDIGTQLYERCATVIENYRFTSAETATCRDRTVTRRTAPGQFSFKGAGCSKDEGSEMNGDLYFKIYSGSCGQATDGTLRLTTGTGILSRVCDGGNGFDYQLPDWSRGTTFDPSGGMCMQLFDADQIGDDDFLCQVGVDPVKSEESVRFDCDWDGDKVAFTLTYQLVPRG